MKKNKVVIIGAGMVGMSYAYSMVNQGTCEELVLIDIDKNKTVGIFTYRFKNSFSDLFHKC